MVELVWGSGTDGAPAIDEELLEIPFAVGNLRYTSLPDAFLTSLETFDYPAAREDWLSALSGLISDGEFFCAAVLGR